MWPQKIEINKFIKMKSILSVILGCISFQIFAQNAEKGIGRVGVNTDTPTETLDVKGTLRIRNLPLFGVGLIHTKENGTASEHPDQVFTGKKPIVADINGVLGKATSYKDLMPHEGSSDPLFTATDDSSAIFVIRRYYVTDWASNQDSGKGFDTEMSVKKWEGIISGWMVGFSDNSIATSVGSFFNQKETVGFRLRSDGNTWRIIGDIGTVREFQHIDVLFIKKTLVASEPRIQ